MSGGPFDTERQRRAELHTEVCACGHKKDKHELPGFDGECIGDGCKCRQYRSAQAVAQLPPPKNAGLAHTPPGSPPGRVAAQPTVHPEPGIAVRGERPPPLELLLQAGQRSSIARTVALTEKIALLLHDLRGRLTDERQSAEEKARRVEEEQAARADVARLTAELEAAKAKLRGRTPPRTSTPSPATPPANRGAVRGALIDCPAEGCGRSFDTPQGAAAHRRRAHEGFNLRSAKAG